MTTERTITFVSSFYNIGRSDNVPSDRNKFKNYFPHVEKLLSLPINLVMYTTQDIKDELEFVERENLHFEITEDFTNKKMAEEIRKGFDESYSKFSTANSLKDTPEYMCIMRGKSDLLKQEIQTNRFETTHFGWIDAGLFGVAPQHDLVEHIIPFDKVRLMFIQYCPLSATENPKFVTTPQYKVAGGFYTGRADYLLRFVEKVIEKSDEILRNHKIFGMDQEFMMTVYNEDDREKYYDPYFGDFENLLDSYYEAKEPKRWVIEQYYNHAMKYTDVVAMKKMARYMTKSYEDKCIGLAMSKYYENKYNIMTETEKMLEKYAAEKFFRPDSKLKVSNAELDSEDLDYSINLCKKFSSFFTGFDFWEHPGKQHYQLLAFLSLLYDNCDIIDIGTHIGASALALSYNPNNRVHTFDIVDKVEGKDFAKKSYRERHNITHYFEDLFDTRTRKKFESLIRSSKIILVDVDPHDGNMEINMYRILRELDYQGIIIWDDVNFHKKFPGMRRFWEETVEKNHKYDLSPLGHFSGTGLVIFSEDTKTDLGIRIDELTVCPPPSIEEKQKDSKPVQLTVCLDSDVPPLVDCDRSHYEWDLVKLNENRAKKLLENVNGNVNLTVKLCSASQYLSEKTSFDTKNVVLSLPIEKHQPIVNWVNLISEAEHFHMKCNKKGIYTCDPNSFSLERPFLIRESIENKNLLLSLSDSEKNGETGHIFKFPNCETMDDPANIKWNKLIFCDKTDYFQASAYSNDLNRDLTTSSIVELLNPGWTLVTAFFDLTKMSDSNPASRTRKHYMENAVSTLSLPNNLVIYCEEDNLEAIKEIRQKYDAELKYTKFVIQNFEDFPLNRYRGKIDENRSKRRSGDQRNNTSYYLFCMSRYHMLKETVSENPFGGTHFAWINFCIARMGLLNVLELQNALELKRDKFSTAYIGYISKKEIEGKDNYNFIVNGKCSMCSGFFTGSAEYMSKVCKAIEVKFLKYVELGYGHADEQLYSPVFFDNPGWFHQYFGDYYSMITNYVKCIAKPADAIKHVIPGSFTDNMGELCARASQSCLDGYANRYYNLTPSELIAVCKHLFASAYFQKDRERMMRSYGIFAGILRGDLGNIYYQEFCKNAESLFKWLDFARFIDDKTTGKEIKVYENPNNYFPNSNVVSIFFLKDAPITTQSLITANPVIRPHNLKKCYR